MRLLSLVGSGQADRTALLAAIAARDAAQREVPAASEGFARLQAVIDKADDSARAAADAQRQARDARQRWVKDGCLSNAQEHHQLEIAAQEAVRAAACSAADAKAASGELRRAQEAIREAQSKVGDCEGTISTEIANIVAAEQERKVARLEALLAELPDAFLDVLAVARVTDPYGRDKDHLRSDEAHRQVSPVLQKLWSLLRSLCRDVDDYSGHPLYEGLCHRKQALLERAAELRRDPDA